MIRLAFSQSYLFWNPGRHPKTNKPHWSQTLPRKPGEVQRVIAEAWLKQVAEYDLDGLYIGNAAHFQKWPARFNIPEFEAMKWGVEAMYDLRSEHGSQTIRGCGVWSKKHLLGSRGRQEIIATIKRPSPEVLRLQELLNATGYEVGEANGIITPLMRRRASAYMMDSAFTPDDFGGAEIIELIRAHTRIEARVA